MAGINALLHSVNDFDNAIIARRVRNDPAPERRARPNSSGRRTQGAATRGRQPWNDRLQLGRRGTKGNGGAGSYIPPWQHLPQEHYTEARPAAAPLRPTFSAKPEVFAPAAVTTDSERNYDRARQRVQLAAEETDRVLAFSRAMKTLPEAYRAEARRKAVEGLEDQAWLAPRIARSCSKHAVEHIIDVAWSLFETRKVEAASQMKMWDTDGDKALGVQEVREILHTRGIGTSAEDFIRQFETQTIGGATVGINDGCISADEFPAFMDLIDKLAPQAGTGKGDEHGIFYDQETGMYSEF